MNQAARAAWACAIALLFHAGTAQAERWTIDPRDSSAGFRVRLFALLPLRGGFGAFAGSIEIDRRGRRARVDARIDASSVVMPNPSHTDWVKSAEFFDVATHPEIRFRSAEFPLAVLVDGGALDGSLSLRGRTRGVRFVVAPGQCAAKVRQTDKRRSSSSCERCAPVATASVARSASCRTANSTSSVRSAS